MTETETRPLEYLEIRIRDRVAAYEAAGLLANKLEAVNIARRLLPTVHALAATLASFVVLDAQQLRTATINPITELEAEQLEEARRHIERYTASHEHHRDAAKGAAVQLAQIVVASAEEEGLEHMAPIFADTVSNAFRAVASITEVMK